MSKIKVARVTADDNGIPKIIEIENDLEALQHEVNGYIEVHHIDSGRVVVCNELGRIRHMKISRFFSPFGPICGPFIVCGLEDGDFQSLTEDQIADTLEQFSL